MVKGWQSDEVDCSTSVVLVLGPIVRLSTSADVSLDCFLRVWRACRGKKAVGRRGLAGRLGLAWKISDDEEKTGRWHVRLSTRVRGHKVVRLSELVSNRVDNSADLGRKQRRQHRGRSHETGTLTWFCQIARVPQLRWSLATTLRVGSRVDSSKKL